MQFVFKPEGAEELVEDWDPLHRIESPDAIEIEKRTGMRFRQWIVEVESGQMQALQALVWILKRRKDPGLQYSQVVFKASDCTWRFTDEDADRMIANLEAQAELEPLREDQQTFLDALREQRDDRTRTVPAEDADVPDPSGKPSGSGKKSASRSGKS